LERAEKKILSPGLANKRILMKYVFIKLIVLTLVYFLASGCSKTIPSDPAFAQIESSNLPTPDLIITVPGLSPCTTSTDPALYLNSKEPVTIIIHGCKASAYRFRSLAQVFAFHGQQAICFNYKDRDSLIESSGKLIDAMHALAKEMAGVDITVIGHSQGGLVTRKALVDNRDKTFPAEHGNIILVTISSPYAGISAAEHCASKTARFLTLGLVVPLCRLISGDKWYEITSRSPFIQQPGELIEQVSSHLKIVTDERNSCRRYQKDTCIEDDFVFSLDEQYFDLVDTDSTVKNIEIQAGHSEIVGNYNVQPQKLIKALQTQGIMHKTLPELEKQFLSFLTQLYSSN